MKLVLKKNEIATVPSVSFEREYLRILNQMLSAHVAYVKANIIPAYQREIRLRDASGDDAGDAFAQFRKFMEETAKAIARTFMRRLFEVEKARGDEKFAQIAEAKLGIDLRRVISNSPKLGNALSLRLAENVRLINNLSDDQISRVEGLVYRNVTSGASARQLSVDLARDLLISKKRAILIARDQTAKLNADLNEARQRAAGFDKYKWLTAGDERVRASHRENDGKIFAWADPPEATGHPGHDINCRCVAIGILE